MQYTINLSRTKVLSILLALTMLIGSIGWIQYSIATTSVPTWTLNAPPTSAYTCYVGQYTNGTYYYEKGDWQTWYNTANASQAINFAIGNLTVGRTSPETVLVQANVSSLTNTIKMQDWTTLKIDGQITAANSLNAPMIANANPTTNNIGITIEGIGTSGLEGNKANQNTLYASGINFTAITAPTGVVFPHYVVKNLYIKNCYSQGVYCNFDGTADGGQVYFEDVSVSQNGAGDSTGFGGGQVVWYGVYDSEWIGGLIDGSNTNYAFLGLTLSGCKINPAYVNGHSKLLNCVTMDIACKCWDNSGAFDTLSLYKVTYSRIHDSTFNFGTAANNTYDGILLGDYSTGNNYNSFYSLIFTYYSNTIQFKYGIEEYATLQNYNLYYGINAYTGTGAVHTHGAQSKVDSGSIIGTIS